MIDKQTASLASQLHIKTIDGATYEVISNYIGDISFLDLLNVKTGFRKAGELKKRTHM